MEIQTQGIISNYSRYVNIMKVFLPIGTMFLLIFALAWPYLINNHKNSVDLLDISSPEIVENRMILPHYKSTDEKGQPFEVNAEWGKQISDNKADLIHPQGTVQTNGKRAFEVEAKTGIYDLSKKTLDLNGQVTLESDDGYKVLTESATLTMDNKTVEGNKYVEGEGPTGTLIGTQGFKVESFPKGKVVTLKGPSTIVIKPKQANQ